jgi:hypothetical protein
MTDDKHDGKRGLLDKLIALLLRLDWPDVLGNVWRALRKALPGQSYKGLYEVLEYESTLELRYQGGKRATFQKREEVRYLQDCGATQLGKSIKIPDFPPVSSVYPLS